MLYGLTQSSLEREIRTVLVRPPHCVIGERVRRAQNPRDRCIGCWHHFYKKQYKHPQYVDVKNGTQELYITRHGDPQERRLGMDRTRNLKRKVIFVLTSSSALSANAKPWLRP